MAEKRLTGRIAAEHIKLLEVPRPPLGAVERFKALGDPTGIISDTMDELGIPSGVIGASVLRPTMPGTTMVGPALTLLGLFEGMSIKHKNQLSDLLGDLKQRYVDGLILCSLQFTEAHADAVAGRSRGGQAGCPAAGHSGLDLRA